MGERYSRQSFLGEDAQRNIRRVRAGVVGLGGGGSHVVQQLAHIGFERYALYDPDTVDRNGTNLNRLVGAVRRDAQDETPKTVVAERVIRGLLPAAEIDAHRLRWQEEPEPLRGCDVVVGCVDTFAERRELEAAMRRYLVPYIDVGMDVHVREGAPPRMVGQVILSMPGRPCMFCLGFLTEERLAEEARRYGDLGERPQVVWPNGVLASAVVGIAVDLVTGWSGQGDRLVYLSYDGNSGCLGPHKRLEYVEDGACPHYPISQTGDPVLRSVESRLEAR